MARSAAVLGILLAAQAALLGYAATRHSPGIDEVGHLGSGLHHWRTGTLDLYRVNPPLVRLVAVAPLAAAGLRPAGVDDPAVAADPDARPEFDAGRRFFARHGASAMTYLTWARWACVPFALLTTAVVFAWAAELYGRAAAALSAALWVVCPNALAHGQMITPDAGATGLGLAATYLFWRWLRAPGWAAAAAAGIVLGLAELCKTTWVLLGPVWVAAWVAYRAGGRGAGWRRDAGQLAAAFAVALYVLNAGYGFEGSGRPLGDFRFVSRALTAEDGAGARANRFAGTAWAGLPVPLPRNYVQGIDVQKRDFEGGLRSYLRGEWRDGGWWHYYAYALLVKTPVGTLAVVGLAAASAFVPTAGRAGWRDEAVVLLPGAVVLGFVSSQTGFNHHMRYVLPAVPFVLVWTGRVTCVGRWGGGWRASAAAATLAAATSSLAVYPHSLSYFNEPAGGPLGGPEHLVDSNVDWGQDLLHLKDWLDAHPDARPLGLAYFGYIDPRGVGIEFAIPPGADGPRPGWYAVSVCLVRGLHYAIPDGAGGVVYVDDHRFGYFGRLRPVATAGYSIYIYHLDRAECDRVRAALGLGPLRPEGS